LGLRRGIPNGADLARGLLRLYSDISWAVSGVLSWQAIAQLTQIKGIGVWTAEVYLLFCLERLSSFPASDLAVQIGYQRLKKLERRPNRKELIASTDRLDPYRGAVAHLLWHYYRHLAQQ
jgi:DNA-3-methyladenine glycosylase II